MATKGLARRYWLEGFVTPLVYYSLYILKVSHACTVSKSCLDWYHLRLS
jgi:hypothetical protein